MNENSLGMAFYRLLSEEEGATAVEYAVILALILMAIIAGISTVGGGTLDLWQNNSDQISNAISGS
ncbi:MAG: Flp family type IVb pilin [Planctomycetota bacterium]